MRVIARFNKYIFGSDSHRKTETKTEQCLLCLSGPVIHLFSKVSPSPSSRIDEMPPHHHRTPSACRGRPQDANAAINRGGPTDGLAPSGDRRDYSCRGRREHPAPSSVRIPDGKSRPQSSGGGGGGSGGGGGGGADRGVTSPSRSLSYLVVSPLTFPTATRAVQGHQ